MKNSKSGVSIIALVVAIIVMGMLLGMTVTVTKGIIQETKARKFASELKQLEYLAKQNKKLNDDEYAGGVTRTLAVDELNKEQKKQMSAEISDETTTITLYELDFKKLDVNDTTYGKKEDGDEDDVYLFSNITSRVYYMKGFYWEGKTYYTLTEELNALLSN